MFSVDISGLTDLTNNLMNMNKVLEEAVKKALLDCGLHLLGESIDLTPLVTGNLRGSGTVVLDEQVMATGGTNGVTVNSKTIKTGRQVKTYFEVIVGYNTVYAMKVHEDLTVSHPVHPDHNCSGGAKYLERPLNQFSQEYNKKIAKAIEKALK